MTEAEFRLDFENFIDILFEEYRHKLPRSQWAGILNPKSKDRTTGNLRNNAYKLTKTSKGYKLWIDDSIAFYAKYIDEPGHVTQGYWNRVMQDITDRIAERYGGILE